MRAARRGVRVDGRNAYGKMFDGDDEQPTAEAQLEAAMYTPAWNDIARYLFSARALGFDPRDPDIVARAIRAGNEAFAARPPKRPHEPKPPASATADVHEPIVYYMQLGDLVKIGTSENIRSRMAALNPERLLAVEAGDRIVETERHSDFAALHCHGEWFRMAPKLADHIEVLRSQFEETLGLTLDAWLARPSQLGKPPTSSASTPGPSPDGPEPEG